VTTHTPSERAVVVLTAARGNVLEWVLTVTLFPVVGSSLVSWMENVAIACE
jgi:hypothetical protein